MNKNIFDGFTKVEKEMLNALADSVTEIEVGHETEEGFSKCFECRRRFPIQSGEIEELCVKCGGI